MKKFLNMLFFLGSVFRAVSINLKSTVPAYQDMKLANQRDQYMKALEEATEVKPIKESENEK